MPQRLSGFLIITVMWVMEQHPQHADIGLEKTALTL